PEPPGAHLADGQPIGATMKAISLKQPWASLLVLGAKRFETRSWHTEHRGPLLVHASKDWPVAARELCLCEPFRSALEEVNPFVQGTGGPVTAALPLGAMLGVVEVVGCHSTDVLRTCPSGEGRFPLSNQEWAFGDYRPGRWAWECKNPRRLRTPWR